MTDKTINHVFDKISIDDISIINDIHPDDIKKVLTLSIIEDKPNIVHELIKDMDINAFINTNDGHTLLMSAIGKKSLKVAKLLLDLGCDTAIKNEEGLTALKLACLVQSLEGVKLLEQYHVAYDDDILRCAFCYARKADLAVYLLEQGANYDMFLDLLDNEKERKEYMENFEVQEGEYFFELMARIHEKNIIEKNLNKTPTENRSIKIKI